MTPTREPKIARVDGDSGLVSAGPLVAALTAAGDAASIVVDLTSATALDSTAIGALIRAHVAAGERGGAIAVAANGENLLRILALAGVTRLLRIFDTVDDARDYLRDLP